MRAVLDTNLLVSYLLTSGETMSGIIDHGQACRFVALVSPAMLAELKEVLGRPRLRQAMPADPQALVDVLEHDAELVPGELVLTDICRDPKDDIFIACAVEGKADYLVSGDEDLLDISSYQGVQMIAPYQFLQVLEALAQP